MKHFTAAVATVALSLALAGCSFNIKTDSAPTTSPTTTSPTTSTTTTSATTSAQAAGPNYTIADYIRDNHIQETPVHHGDPGSPTIDLPVPDDWRLLPESSRAPYGGIVYTQPADPNDPPTIVAILSKLTGDIDPAKVLQFAPGELKNLPGFQGSGDGSAATLGGFSAWQLGGSYSKNGKLRTVAQKTVVISQPRCGVRASTQRRRARRRDDDVDGRRQRHRRADDHHALRDGSHAEDEHAAVQHRIGCGLRNDGEAPTADRPQRREVPTVQGEDRARAVSVGQHDVGRIRDPDPLILVFRDDAGGLLDFGGTAVGELPGPAGEFTQDGELGIDTYPGGDEIVEFRYHIRGYDERVCGAIDALRHCGVVWLGGVEIGKQRTRVDDHRSPKPASSSSTRRAMGSEPAYRPPRGGGLAPPTAARMDSRITCASETPRCRAARFTAALSSSGR